MQICTRYTARARTISGTVIIALGIVSMGTAGEGEWWPSEWGETDQRGAVNRITADKVRQASRLVQKGRVYSLGQMYEPDMPLFGNRPYSLTIVSSPTGGPAGTNQVVWHDEMFSGEIGQIGTQFDGLGHVGTRINGEDVFYNGFTRSDLKGAYGLAKLGVENVGPIYTRGVLIDVAAHKRTERLDVGYVISERDLTDTLRAQRQRVTPGDVVLIRTGHSALWIKDNETYNSGAPGIGTEAAKWLAGEKVVMVGSDTWCVEAVPGEKEDYAFKVHQVLIVQNGIYLIENLNLEELANDKAYEFAFIFSPLPFKGATGSPGNPIAVK